MRPLKLKDRIYTTVAELTLTSSSKWCTMYTTYEELGKDVTTRDMKICRISLVVTEIDHKWKVSRHNYTSKKPKSKMGETTGSPKVILKMKALLISISYPLCINGLTKCNSDNSDSILHTLLICKDKK